MSAVLEEVEQVAQESLLLGEIVTWDVESLEVPLSDVREALREAGLDVDAAGDMRSQAAFSRACKFLKENRSIDKLKSDKSGLIRFQFTHKEQVGDQVEFERECLVVLNSNTGDVECPEMPDLANEARKLVDHAMHHRSAQDVTRIVQGLFKNHADLFPINPRKGVAYFVPEQHREFTSKVERFLGRMSGKLGRFPVPRGTPEGNANVKDAVQGGLRELLSELNQAVAAWDDDTRDATKTRALERWQVIAHKVDCYAEYLGGEQSRLMNELRAAKERLVEQMSKPDSVENN